MIIASCSSSKKVSNTNENPVQSLVGTWELIEIEGEKYSQVNTAPSSTPFIKFDEELSRISGKTGCNSFSGEIVITGNNLDLTKPMMMTKMYCEGVNETKFMETLRLAKEWRIDNEGRLELVAGEVVLMEFIAKK
jgi:heat shock protein HslJ